MDEPSDSHRIIDSGDTESLENDSRSFLPYPIREGMEDSVIRSTISGNDHIQWPSIGEHAVNEFATPFLATMAFPTLFPYGTGDPTNPGRQRSVSLLMD